MRLASHKRLFDPRLVVFQLFARNTEDLFGFAIAFLFYTPHILLLCGRILVFALSSPICISWEVEDLFLLFDPPVATFSAFVGLRKL